MRAHRNCCGLDVHKKMIAACLIREDAEGNSVTEKRLFGSMTRELHALAQWLCAAQVTAVAMEATGVYWMPVWNVLEQYGLQLLLVLRLVSYAYMPSPLPRQVRWSLFARLSPSPAAFPV